MANITDIQQTVEESALLLQTINSNTALLQATADAVNICVSALRKGKKILFCGNGGSAADAQHWAGELVSRFYYDRPGLPAIALTTDTSILTAIGNDYGYDCTFSRQIEALGAAGDVLIAISTSGNSKNVVEALDTAHHKGIVTVGFTGKRESAMLDRCDLCIRVPSTSTPRIQEGHEVLGHTICALIEAEMFPKESSYAE